MPLGIVSGLSLLIPSSLPPSLPFLSSLFHKKYIYIRQELILFYFIESGGRGRERERERESQAGPMLSAEPNVGQSHSPETCAKIESQMLN